MKPVDTMEERDRKAEHIELALDPKNQLERKFFDEIYLEHEALPEIDLAEVDTSVEFLGRTLSAPLLISCMTGGTGEATRINRNLAAAAEQCGVACGVGSQRKALEDASTEESFRIRPLAPNVPLLGNLGAVQFNYGFGIEECRRAVEMIEADALYLHLNVLQEAIQPEGQCNFKGLVERIGEIASQLEVPIIIKEIGCGISGKTARRLHDAGIRMIDTAGLGGTSWSRIEGHRAEDIAIGDLFANWGVPTTRSIRELAAIDGMTVIGSGGLRTGIDAAKSIALGADLVGMAYQFLLAANESTEKVVEKIEQTVRELKISMFCCGARNVTELKQVEVRSWSEVNR